MRILMLTDSMDCGGAETHVLELSSALVALGHRVCVASSGGALVKQLLGRGVFHIRLPLNKRGALFLYPIICRLVKRWDFDIIHSHARIPSFIAAVVAKRTGVCFVSTVHARFSSKGFRRRLSRWGEKSIAVSEDLKQYLVEEYRVPVQNISVIPNGINTSHFCTAFNTSGGVTRIAFLSRLDGECSAGAFYLCDIACQLYEHYGRIEILIGGGGDALTDVRKAAERVNSELGFECVKVLGHIGDVPSFLNSADIFVGVSRAALEAALCGLSVIICGNEGFLGRLREDNFEQARASNFCARGERVAKASELYYEIEELLRQDEHTRRNEALRVSSLIKKLCNSKSTAQATERFYRWALSCHRKGQSSVFLCGYYGFGNMGDDALLQSSVAIARRKFPQCNIVALTKSGRSDEKRFRVRCVSRKNVIGVAHQIKNCTHFVLGGGTLLQDHTSFRSLMYYCALLRFAKRSGAKCYMWGNGIGPLRLKKSLSMTSRALSFCDYIGLRDERSFKLAHKLLGDNSRIRLESDLAMRESDIFEQSERRVRYLLKDIPKEFLIVVLKGKKCPIELQRRLDDARRSGIFLLFVVMYEEQDGRISKRYAQKYGGKVMNNICFGDLIALARHSLGVYSMRFHALVAAKVTGVSFCGFGSEQKIKDFK